MQWRQQLVILEEASPCKRTAKTERKIMYFRNKPIKDAIIAAIKKNTGTPSYFYQVSGNLGWLLFLASKEKFCLCVEELQPAGRGGDVRMSAASL